MLTFTMADIARSIDLGTLGRGRGVHAQGQVLEADVNSSGTVIVGRVRGSEPKPYSQMITLKQGKLGVEFSGTCSCPVRVNCKHVAAVLIEAARQAPERAAEAAKSTALVAVPQGRPQALTPQARSTELSPQLQRWLGDVDEAAKGQSSGNDYPPEIKQRLIYVIEIEPARNGFPARSRLKPMVSTLGKGGELGPNAKVYAPSNIFNYQPAKHLRPIDHEILSELDFLMRRTGSVGNSELPLTGHPQLPRLLAKILGTGRCRLGSVQGPVLSESPARVARPRWVRGSGPAGRQRLIFEAEPDADGVVEAFDAVLPLAPPYYLDATSGLTGPLETGLPPALAARLAEAPEVSSSEAAQLGAMLGQRIAASGATAFVPLPATPQKAEMRQVRPVPRLELYIGDVRIKHHYSWYIREPQHRGAFKLPLARLAFDYGGEIVPFQARTEVLERLQAGQVRPEVAEGQPIGCRAGVGQGPLSRAGQGRHALRVPGRVRRSRALSRLLHRGHPQARRRRLADRLLGRLSLPHR
jgi:hypothetical protein